MEQLTVPRTAPKPTGLTWARMVLRRPRDMQKRLIYRAENWAFRQLGKAGRDIPDVNEAEAFVRYVANDPWFVGAYGKVSAVSVHWRPRSWRGGIIASASSGTVPLRRYIKITISPDALHKWVLLHEVAHAVTPHTEQAHGRVFAQNYIALVGRYLGAAEASGLRRQFRACGVKYRKTRALTESQYEAACARLTAARAKWKAAKEQSSANAGGI